MMDSTVADECCLPLRSAASDLSHHICLFTGVRTSPDDMFGCDVWEGGQGRVRWAAHRYLGQTEWSAGKALRPPGTDV